MVGVTKSHPESEFGIEQHSRVPLILGTFIYVDAIDKKIVQLLQDDASRSTREIADLVGLSSTPCWRRIQQLKDRGVITGHVALVDPRSVNLALTALVLIRTSEHNAAWTDRLIDTLSEFDEIVEAFRTSGETDYLLKVLVPDMDAYDSFYQRLIERIDLYDVRTTFVMEEMKRTTSLSLDYV